MLKKLLIVAAGLIVSAPAFADHGRQKHYWKHQPHYHPRPVVVMPAPRVYYAPPPAPVYYAPRPVYSAPAPHSGISIRLHFPL